MFTARNQYVTTTVLHQSSRGQGRSTLR